MSCPTCSALHTVTPSLLGPDLPPGTTMLADAVHEWLVGCDACDAVWRLEEIRDTGPPPTNAWEGVPMPDHIELQRMEGWRRSAVSREGFAQVLEMPWDSLSWSLSRSLAKELTRQFPDLCRKAARRSSSSMPFSAFREWAAESEGPVAPAPSLPVFFEHPKDASIAFVTGGEGLVVVGFGAGKGRREVAVLEASTGRKIWKSEVFSVPRDAPDEGFSACVADSVVVHVEGVKGVSAVRLVATRGSETLWKKQVSWSSRTLVESREEEGGSSTWERVVHNHRISVENGVVFAADKHDLVAWKLDSGEELFRASLGEARFSGVARFEDDLLRFVTLDGLGALPADGEARLESSGTDWAFVTAEGLVASVAGELADPVAGWRTKLPATLEHALWAVGEEAVVVSNVPGPFVVRRDGMRMPAGPPLNWPVTVRRGGFVAKTPENDGILLLDAFGRQRFRVDIDNHVRQVLAFGDGALALTRGDPAEVVFVGADGAIRRTIPAEGAERIHVGGDLALAAKGSKLLRIPLD